MHDKVSLIGPSSEAEEVASTNFMLNENEKRLNYFKLSANKPLRMDVIFGILAVLLSVTAVALLTCLPLSFEDSDTAGMASEFL